MIQIAAAILRLPDGRLVFQRRTDDARISPGKLGLFGGHVEEGEAHPEAVRRELTEETSLPVSELELRFIGSFDLPKGMTTQLHEDITFHLYLTDILSDTFEVYEGVGAETYTIDEIVVRSDVTGSARYMVEQIKEK